VKRHGEGRVKTLRIGLGVSAAMLCIGLLFAGLWPFSFSVRNQMHWGKDGGALRGDRFGIASTRDALQLLDDAHDAFTLEMTVRSLAVPQGYIGRLLCIAGPDGAERLMVGQWNDDLLVRIPGQSGERGYRELTARNAFAVDGPLHFLFTVQAGSASLWVNGETVVHAAPLTVRHLAGSLILGNAPSGTKGWTGQYYALVVERGGAAGDEARVRSRLPPVGDLGAAPVPAAGIVSYTLASGSGGVVPNMAGAGYGLVIPERVGKRNITVLHLPFDEVRLSREYLLDVALNSLGFIPFGFCVTLLMLTFPGRSRRRAVALTTALGTIISLAIEVTQAWMLTRSSQLSDLVLNAASAFVGALFCLLPLWVEQMERGSARGGTERNQ
jgi:hypothetical protein